MVASSKKTNDEWGIPGYEFVKYNAHFRDKPTVYSIPKPPDKEKTRDFISMLQRQKKNIPGPIYETGLNIAQPGKFFIPKGKGTFFDEIIKKAKFTPGIGKYDIAKKAKILGNYKSTQEGGGSVDEAKAIGMATPAPYNAIDLDIIKHKTFALKISKPKLGPGENKLVKNNDPNPHTYKKEESYDKTQGQVIRYGIPKGAKQSFTDSIMKSTKINPGVGKYDITKADRVITLGARKSYR